MIVLALSVRVSMAAGNPLSEAHAGRSPTFTGANCRCRLVRPDGADEEDAMDWSDLEQRQPRLAARARELLVDPGVLLAGTTRADGTARISAVEPFLLDGDLWLSMMWGSRKAADLLRDPRVLVHSIV